MISKVFFYKRRLYLPETFKVTYEEVDSAEIIYIKIIDKDGNFGLGSVAVDEAVTGESLEAADVALKEKLSVDFFCWPMEFWYHYHELIQDEFAGLPAVQSAIEEAVLNLFCQKKGITLVELFGGYRRSCPISITVCLKSLPATVRSVKERLRQGYRLIKLKGGLDWNDDCARIQAVSKILPSQAKLLIDLNQGYSYRQTELFLRKIKNFPVCLIEQPVAAKDIESLKRLQQLTAIPIIADEAAVSVEQSSRLLIGNYINGVNIKLIKCGGPINALKIYHLARSLGKIVMIGCTYESNISITTAASLALALPIDYVDLDSGHLDFPKEPARGGARFRRGGISIAGPLRLII